jgi:hypothetical protein
MSELKKRSRTSELQILWLSVLLPPIVWAVQMEINYSLLKRACVGNQTLALKVTMLVSLAITILSAVVAWAFSWPSTAESKQIDFVGKLGLFSSAIFFGVTLAQGTAAVMFHPCQL